MRRRDRMNRARTATKWALHTAYKEPEAFGVRGDVFVEMRDARSGDVLEYWEKRNIITLDAGILAARLFKDNAEPNFGLNMLAVGTGALGSANNPDAPPPEQRVLNAELERKPFDSTTFRDSQGAAVAIPTNVVDFTTIYTQSEAIGALNEMGLLSTISANPAVTNPNPNAAGQGGQPYDPTIDVTLYDMQVNYLTFGVINKPNTAILTITWRLTF